jgi:hypothetical protein
VSILDHVAAGKPSADLGLGIPEAVGRQMVADLAEVARQSAAVSAQPSEVAGERRLELGGGCIGTMAARHWPRW